MGFLCDPTLALLLVFTLVLTCEVELFVSTFEEEATCSSKETILPKFAFALIEEPRSLVSSQKVVVWLVELPLTVWK